MARASGPHPRPRKRLGQHFLTDRRILERIVAALQLEGGETVVEIGAGRGALTDALAQRCARLIAIELDRELAPALRARYASRPHVTIVEADVLDLRIAELAATSYRVVGNLPYYITTPILFHVMRRPRPDVVVFLVQREVADRLAAAPGDSSYGALSVNVQAVARVECLFRVAAGSFWPPPAVDSAVVRLTPRPDPAVTAYEEEAFRRFVQAAFARRRKQLTTVVRYASGLGAAAARELILACGLDPAARPETLSAGAFAALWRGIAREG